MIEFSLISSVGAFYFAIQLWCSGFNAHILDVLIFDMPMKTDLKLVTPIRSDRTDPEGKFFDHIVDELDRTGLVIFRIDL